jgi:hypothetical protein
MAYSATYVLHHLGGRNYRLVITEEEATATSEVTIEGLPKYGIVLSRLFCKRLQVPRTQAIQSCKLQRRRIKITPLARPRNMPRQTASFTTGA